MFEKRRELKFTTNEIYYSDIINWIKNNKVNFKKHFPKRLINSIYFDNYSYSSFKENIYGDSKKTKIRLRWYNTFFFSIDGFFEVKKRDNIYNYKKTIKIPNLAIKPNSNFKEIIQTLKFNLEPIDTIELDARPFPTIISQYTREYYIDFDKEIRITIDRNIKTFDQRLSNKINLKNEITIPNLMVVEFKFKDASINKLLNSFNNFPLRLSKNSKYINGIRAASGV